MIANLPPTIASFIAASNARDLEGAIACFAADAVVEDEGQTHHGIEQVRDWKDQTERAFSYTIEPTGIEQPGGETIVTGTLAGDFPGSPIELYYEFTLVGDLIQALRIHP
jgi:ketosteroid isomerase-like protein